MPPVPTEIQAMTDAELAAYPVPLRAYGKHSAEERAVIAERLRRIEEAEERALAERGFPKGRRVRIAESYRRHMTHGHWAGRAGVVVRPAMRGDYAYVQLDPRPRERTEKVQMIAVADLEPLPAAAIAPGQRAEAQRRGPTGIGWHPCQIIDAAHYGARVRFADGAELPRTLDSIRAVGAHEEAQ